MNLKTKWKLVGIFLVFVFLLNLQNIQDVLDNLSEKNPEEVPEPIYLENTPDPDIYFCAEDDCEGELVAWLGAAEKYIHCAFFEVGLEEVHDKLLERSKEIEVKLIVDDRYIDEVSDLDFVRDDNRSALMHNKFCVLDGKAVWTGSFNPTERGAHYNDNNAVFYQSQLLAGNYEDEFQEMWNGEFGKGARTSNPTKTINGKNVSTYFCPEDWCSNKLIYELQDARESIYFMTFSFTHDEVGKAVLERAGESVEVKGVFEKSQNNKYTEKVKFDEAEISGIEVRWDGNGANMHHKVFIIDEKTVVTGSFNPSANADKRNDENLLIIHDPEVASQYMEEFKRVWGEAES